MTHVLVTGAATGFGRLTTEALLLRGARVYAGIRDVAGRHAAAAAAIRAAGGTVVELDVTSDASVQAGVAEVLGDAGHLDAVVHSAGLAAAGLIETFTADQARRLFDTNAIGAHRVTRAVLPGMRARGTGALIYLSSTLAREILPFLGLYVATKHALDVLAEATRYETEPLGIDTVVVQPGTFPMTGMITRLVAPEDPDRAQGYGPVAALPGALFGAIQQMVDSGAAPDPALVATAIADAVFAPAGQRPRRLVIDPNGGGGAARLNALSDEVQAALLGTLGMSHHGRPPR